MHVRKNFFEKFFDTPPKKPVRTKNVNRKCIEHFLTDIFSIVIIFVYSVVDKRAKAEINLTKKC